MHSASGAASLVDPTQYPGWDEWLVRLPGATPFHTASWANVLVDTYGFRPCYFARNRPEQPGAVLPMMEVSSWLTGRRGVGIPFTDEAPPLSVDSESVPLLVDEAVQYAKERKWRSLEVRGDCSSFNRENPSTTYLGHTLALARPVGELLAGVASSVRRAIRKAEDAKLVASLDCSMESVREFCRLLALTRRKHGVPPQPFAFFENIQRRILAPGKGVLMLATYQGRTAAGAMFLHFGSSVVYKFGASDEALQIHRGSNFVMWEAIKHYATRGFACLDFGRTSIANEGLRRFKLSWGTSERTISYLRLDPANKIVQTTPDGTPAWFSHLVRRLPIPVTKLIGQLLYRHVA